MLVAFSLSLSSTMVVVSRIDWIIGQIRMGRRAHIAIGEAQDASKVKIKIILDPADSGEISPALADTLISTLQNVRTSCH